LLLKRSFQVNKLRKLKAQFNSSEESPWCFLRFLSAFFLPSPFFGWRVKKGMCRK
jgi:hypothetical protein